MKSQNEDYKGHRIELQQKEGKAQLSIDKKPMRYGQLPDGSYFLYEYAYDPADDLMELARKFVIHRDKAIKIREQQTKKGGK